MEPKTLPPLNHTKGDLPALRERLAWHLENWRFYTEYTTETPEKKLYNLVRWLAEDHCVPTHDRDLGAPPTGYFAVIKNLELRASFDGWKSASVRMRHKDGSSTLLYQASEGNKVRVYTPGQWLKTLEDVH